MSATLSESVAWDQMTAEQKRQRAGLPLLVEGRFYTVTREWGTAKVRCLNVATKQFRVISVKMATCESENWAGWLVELAPDVLASLKPYSEQP